MTRSPERYLRKRVNLILCNVLFLLLSSFFFLLSSFLGSTAQLTPWPPPENPAEFLGGFSTIFFFTE
jgi:hypothetical protein